jgi:hypothetical protein
VTPYPRSQLLLRALVLLGPVVAVLATGPAGSWPPWWLVAGVVALAGAGAVASDSQLLSGAGLVALVWWTIGLDDDLTGWVVVAAAALVVGHVAALLASYGPATMPVHPSLVRLWTRRGGLVLLVVPAAWAVTRLLRGDPEQPGIWVLGVATVLVATLVATAALAVRDADGPPGIRKTPR